MYESLLFFLFCIAVLLALPQLWERRVVDTRQRLRCPVCGYGLQGMDDIGVCPECRHQYSKLPVWTPVWMVRQPVMNMVLGVIGCAALGTWLSGAMLLGAHVVSCAVRDKSTVAQEWRAATHDLPLWGGTVFGPTLFAVACLMLIPAWRVNATRRISTIAGAGIASCASAVGVAIYMLLNVQRAWDPSDFRSVAGWGLWISGIGAFGGWAFAWWRSVKRWGWGVEV